MRVRDAVSATLSAKTGGGASTESRAMPSIPIARVHSQQWHGLSAIERGYSPGCPLLPGSPRPHEPSLVHGV